MQHRISRIAVSSLVVALAVAATARAVTGSVPDGDGHPYVGAVVVGGAVACSAVLVAPDVVATAAHCGTDGARVGITFDGELADGWSVLEGTFEADPAKGSDLAVVVLDVAAAVEPASLPSAGAAGGLEKGTSVTSVGYGYSGRAADGSFVYDGLRRVADSPVLKVGKSTITLSTEAGGPCMGDSGGPQLLGDTVVSLTSTGAKDCSGKAAGLRLDTSSARAFLAEFAPLP